MKDYLTYAHVIDGIVVNFAAFVAPPDEAFAQATGGEWVYVPDDLPVGIGHKWDSENFLTPEGDVIVSGSPEDEDMLSPDA